MSGSGLSENMVEMGARKQARMRKRRARLRRSIRLIPNLFTLANALFGFCSIVFAAQKNFPAAAYSILLGAMMDALDGRIARMTHSTSEIGMQLDSLCDAISFCLAPAFLLYSWQLRQAGVFGFIVCALFLLAGVFRLARFNVTHDQQTIYFLGIPVTIAGCCVATVLLNYPTLEASLITVMLLGSLTLFLAGLMVSTIYFPTFKHISRRWLAANLVMFVAFIVSFGSMRVLLALFVLYFIFGLASAVYRVARSWQAAKKK